MYFAIKQHQINNKDMVRYNWVIKWLRRHYADAVIWVDNDQLLYGSFESKHFNPFVEISKCELPKEPLLFYQTMKIIDDDVRFYVGSASLAQITILNLLSVKFPKMFILN